MSKKQVSTDCLKQDALLIFFFFFHSFSFVNPAFNSSFNNSCIFQILLQYMSNYVNFKLLGKALEQTKSYKNQQIDRNFYSYLKKIGCLYSYWKQDAVWKKSIQPVYSTVCTKQMVLLLTVRFRWSDFFATHSFPLLVQWLLGLICGEILVSDITP